MLSKKILIIVITIIIVLLVINIYLNSNSKIQSNKQTAVLKCINLCNEKLDQNLDLSSGPCLSNNIIDDWVCDVAHYPRQKIDNKIENQCSEYVHKNKHHFVEVSTTCKLIKVV